MTTEDPYELILDVLLELPPFQLPENRNVLFDALPSELANNVARSQFATTDLNNLINLFRRVGKLENGELPVLRIIRTVKRYLPPDPDMRRRVDDIVAAFEPSTRMPLQDSQPEVVIGADDRLPFHFFTRMLEAQKSVARLSVKRIRKGMGEGRFVGTGWLLAPGLLITNYHVIATLLPGEAARPYDEVQGQVPTTEIWFGYNLQDGAHDDYRALELLQLNPSLDYAILKVAERSQEGKKPIGEWGYLKTHKDWPELKKGDRLNIIQHAQGQPKSFAIRSNYYVSQVNETRVHYLTDTEPGASGSPVFDDQWEVAALHAAAVQIPREVYKGLATKFHNEGIKLESIFDDLRPELLTPIGTAQGW